MPFKKGQSGNPLGRGIRSKEKRQVEVELKQIAKTHTQEALDRLVFWMRSDEPKASVTATTAILDRAHGKPVQQIDMDVRQKPCDISAEPLPAKDWDEKYGEQPTH